MVLISFQMILLLARDRTGTVVGEELESHPIHKLYETSSGIVRSDTRNNSKNYPLIKGTKRFDRYNRAKLDTTERWGWNK